MGAVGRDGQLESISAWLHEAIADRPRSGAFKSVLVLQGEPGIGKTTVWGEAVAQAANQGWTVLSCRPRPSDVGLSHVGLADLLRPVPDEVFQVLPPPQRRPLEVAILVQEAGEGHLEPRAVGTAFAAVLRSVEDRGPLLLAVDDAQWLDRASASSLAFALHRLDDRAVRLLMAVRVEGVPARQPSVVASLESAVGRERLQHVSLGPLSVAAIHQVFLDVLGKSFTRPVLLRIHNAAGGNPFYALEIAREVERLGPPPPGRPLPVPADHRDLALLRLGRLPRSTRDVLAQIAAMSRPLTSDLDLEALAPAERAGVVRVQADGRVDFTHPLFGSVLYDSLAEAARRKLHGQLAERVTSLEERARHIALAAIGPDETSAQVLDRAAEAAGARGAAEVAVEMKELAVRLTPPEDTRAVVRRALELSSRRYFAGDASGARRELEQSLRSLPGGDDRAEVLLELGSVLWNQGEGDEGLRLISEALEETHTRSLQARIHARASSLAEDFDFAVEHAEAALALIDEHQEPVLYSFALHNLARSKLHAGGDADHEAIAKGILQARSRRMGGQHRARLLGTDFDDFATARHRFEELLRVLRERGDEASSSGILAQLAVIEALTGHLDRARRFVADALDLAHQTEQDTWINVALNAQGQFAVRSGDLDEARAAGEEVLRRLEEHPDAVLECMVRAVLGLAALSARDFAETDRQLSRSDAILALHHHREPASDRFHGDHAEAVIALGDLDRAAVMVARMEARALKIPRPWILVTSARCRGLLLSARGDLDGALAAMQAAVAHQEHLDMPFEGARTLLALGQVHRRRNERRAARSALEEALVIFEQLGVTPWAERTRAELARVPVRRAPADLTPTEDTIARLAGSGLTNKEVAERAFVSVKTVEANLSRAYDKLGIHSRAELGRVMFERERTAKT